MTKPLALVVYQSLMPGSQVVNRLQDLGYRVLSMNDPWALRETAEREKPIVVVIDLACKSIDPLPAITAVRQHGATSHIPIVAFAQSVDDPFIETAQNAGVTLVANEAAILTQLPRLLDRALECD